MLKSSKNEKPSNLTKKKNKIYFGKDVQNAIIQYNISTSKREQHELFKIIYPALLKLCENIINKWKFWRYETDFKDLQLETVSELLTKLPGYDENFGKAYSYFTIIARNYLIRKGTQQYDLAKRRFDLEHIDIEREKYLLNELSRQDYNESVSDFLYLWCEFVDKNLHIIFKNDSDIKIADSFIEILKNSRDLDIYNKKLVYHLIRERSDVQTQNITKVIKYFKTLFFSMLNDFQKTGLIIVPEELEKMGATYE